MAKIIISLSSSIPAGLLLAEQLKKEGYMVTRGSVFSFKNKIPSLLYNQYSVLLTTPIPHRHKIELIKSAKKYGFAIPILSKLAWVQKHLDGSVFVIKDVYPYMQIFTPLPNRASNENRTMWDKIRTFLKAA